jgi:hypothetical protein
MGALDYEFRKQGDVVRLKALLRRGWSDGPYGHYYLGVCTFDWRFGIAGRAEVRLSPFGGCTLETLETLELETADDAGVQWHLAEGLFQVDVCILSRDTQGNLYWNSLATETGVAKVRMQQSQVFSTDRAQFKGDVRIFFNLDRDRRDVISWSRGSGMASAGLPSLGKRR